MRLTMYGKDVLLKFALAVIAVLVLTFAFVGSAVIVYVILFVVVALTAFVLNFFRDPVRHPPAGEGVVVSPADGKVVLIKELVETEYIHGDAVQVSVFMSPLDVHVNRFPITGTVGHFRYIPGEFLVAFDDKCSERNERTHIGVEGNGYKVLFKQISGAIARRIVAPIEVGQPAVRGERFGMIKFGSRVDVIMPRASAVKVKLNERVRAGETILAAYNETAGNPPAHVGSSVGVRE